MRKLTLLTLIILALSFNFLYAQENNSAESDQSPWFYYWPEEDPDNFSSSTMEASELESTQPDTSLGKEQFERKSNQDVNKTKEETQNTQVDTSTVDENISEVESVNQQGTGTNQNDSTK